MPVMVAHAVVTNSWSAVLAHFGYSFDSVLIAP
jgi:hypothetical protein